ncbi:MAG: permease [Proteobacteria bacterium]|nr:permease [Pseudomonadota bacterium]MCP4917865.1 permease [Pseudomonadota bacterium]
MSIATVPVAQADQNSRAAFIAKTYVHLFGAIGLFTVIEAGLFLSGLAQPIAEMMLSVSWLLVLGGFMVVGWIASAAAARAKSLPAQYAALLAYVGAEAFIFVPMLYLADLYAPGAISSAALVTLLGFGGLTGIALQTRKDFTFMGGMLRWIGVGVLLLIVGSIAFGFELGVFFSVAMVVFAGAVILYQTSNIMQNYPKDKYVSASLALFAAVALMFWYVLRIFMSRR